MLPLELMWRVWGDSESDHHTCKSRCCSFFRNPWKGMKGNIMITESLCNWLVLKARPKKSCVFGSSLFLDSCTIYSCKAQTCLWQADYDCAATLWQNWGPRKDYSRLNSLAWKKKKTNNRSSWKTDLLMYLQYQSLCIRSLKYHFLSSTTQRAVCSYVWWWR